MAPQVQTLAEVMAGLDPAYSAQTSVIQKRQAGLGAKYDAQRAGLAAEKGQGFNAINNQATGRGMSFSGIPIDEQATYLSTKYLPGVQQANYQQNDEDLTLQGQVAEIGTQKANRGLDIVEKQKSDLNQWNQNERSIQAQAEAARLSREFEASENAKNRAASAAEAAANRAASAPTGPSRGEIISGLNNWTSGKAGADGKLSPTDFKKGYQKAAEYGMSVDDYTAVMYRYINTSHAKDYAF